MRFGRRLENFDNPERRITDTEKNINTSKNSLPDDSGNNKSKYTTESRVLTRAINNPIVLKESSTGNIRIEEILKNAYSVSESDFDDKDWEVFNKRNLKPLVGGLDNEVILYDNKGKLFLYNFDDGPNAIASTDKYVKDYEKQLKKFLK